MKSNNMTIRTGVAISLLAVAATGAMGASHREAPAITHSPKVDGTDFYMFRSYEPGRQGYVTFIANYQPLQAPYGGPNYFTMDEDAIYEIHVDNDGDAVEDLTFQFDFDNMLGAGGNGIALTIGNVDVAIPLKTAGQVSGAGDATVNEQERYSLNVVTGDRRSGTIRSITSGGNDTFVKPLDYIGEKTFPDYEAYANSFVYDIDIPGCATPGRAFAGQREEAFAVNLGEIFDLVNMVPLEGSIPNDRANDDLSDLQ